MTDERPPSPPEDAWEGGQEDDDVIDFEDIRTVGDLLNWNDRPVGRHVGDNMVQIGPGAGLDPLQIILKVDQVGASSTRGIDNTVMIEGRTDDGGDASLYVDMPDADAAFDLARKLAKMPNLRIRFEPGSLG